MLILMDNQKVYNMDRQRNSGFTLVELSVVLVVLSLLTAGGLALGTSMVDRSAHVDTRKQLEQLEQSLRDYYIVEGRLPCVASLEESTSSTSFGVEIGATGTTCQGGLAAPAGTERVDIGGGVYVRVGMVPVRTLGLSDAAAGDKFGNRIVYAVAERLTDAGEFGGAPGAITVRDMGNNPILSDAAYFIGSPGKDHKGAYRFSTGNPETACGASGNLDVENCTLTNAIFRDAPFNSGSEENFFFDDLVRWAPKYHLSATETQSNALWAATVDDIYSIGTDGNTDNTNVGIGIGTPLAKLHVKGNVFVDGNMGIGTSSPQGKLDVYHDGAHGLLLTGTTNQDRYIRFVEDRLTGANQYKGGFLRYDSTNNNFIMGTHETNDTLLSSDINALSIQRSTGNVTVNGTFRVGSKIRLSETASDATLQLGMGGGTRAYITGNASNTGRLDIMGAESGTDAAYIDLNGRFTGNVGRVGLIAATDTVDYTVTHYFGKNHTSSGIDWVAAMYSNGAMVIKGISGNCWIGTGSGATSCSSDKRLKKDITLISDALEKLNSINGVYYRWNEKSTALDKESKRLGVIAQEVRKVFPEAVMEDPNGYLAVSLDGLVPVLIESVKELNEKNIALQMDVANLGKRVAALESGVTPMAPADTVDDNASSRGQMVIIALLTLIAGLLAYRCWRKG